MRRTERREFLRLAASVPLFLAAIPAWAETGDASAIAPIERLNYALLAVMKAGEQTDFARRFSMLAPAAEGAFDFGAILRASVGPSWMTLAQTDKTRLLASFRRYTISTYVASFDHWTGQSLRISPSPRSLPDGRAVVQTFIVPRSGDPTELSYVMRQGAAGWRATDVLAAGSISRVAVQRSDFIRLLSDGGARALMASLDRKVADLSGGTLVS
jgi:phospholipid transport system substrate-binding protein